MLSSIAPQLSTLSTKPYKGVAAAAAASSSPELSAGGVGGNGDTDPDGGKSSDSSEVGVPRATAAADRASDTARASPSCTAAGERRMGEWIGAGVSYSEGGGDGTRRITDGLASARRTAGEEGGVVTPATAASTERGAPTPSTREVAADGDWVRTRDARDGPCDAPSSRDEDRPGETTFNRDEPSKLGEDGSTR